MSEDVEFPTGRWGRVPAAEIEVRVDRFQRALRSAAIDLALVVQNADLFYLTGTVQQGQLLVPAEGEPVFLVRKDIARARHESSLRRIEPITSLRELPPAVAKLGVGPAPTLGLELDVIPVSVYRRYESLFREASIRDCSPLLRQVRSIKSSYELELIAQAAEIVDAGVCAVAGALREGVTELELSAVCEGAMRAVGNGMVRYRAFNEEWSFSNVSAGPNAALPAFAGTPLGGAGISPALGEGSGWRAVRRGEPVVVDLVASAGGYLADQTRIMSVGPLDADLQEGYELCLGAQDLIKKVAMPGVACGEVYRLVTEWMSDRLDETGLSASFMGAPENQVPYIGHGVGVELDELPVIARGFKPVLQIDQVIACEPKLVFPGRGVVGIENTWRVTDNGLSPITISGETTTQI